MTTKQTLTGKAMTTTQVSCRIPVEAAEYLYAKARADDRSLSYVVGAAIQEWIDRDKAG